MNFIFHIVRVYLPYMSIFVINEMKFDVQVEMCNKKFLN